MLGLQAPNDAIFAVAAIGLLIAFVSATQDIVIDAYRADTLRPEERGVLEDARDAGALVLLSHAPETGYTVFATPEHSFVMHLGHPEYEPSRLIEEWQRDARLGRTDVEPPRNFDLGAPVNTWRPHRAAFFSGWIRLLQSLRVTPQPNR